MGVGVRILAEVTGLWAPTQQAIFRLKLILETRLYYECLEL